MLQKLINISKNGMKRHNFSVMFGKVVLRFQEYPQSWKKDNVLEWCVEKSESYEKFAQSLDAVLWEETQATCQKLRSHAQAKLDNLEIDLGGGGNYPFLYFLIRYLSAKIVVETGVAAGWTSQAILTALKINNNGGKLYSSDFPYFRCNEPEKLIGYVVDDNLKTYWNLFIDGDQNNLSRIAESVGAINLFHYDSDKSYNGRENALKTLGSKFHKDCVVIFDDIQDNFHFRDYVEKNERKFKVFEFEGKYVGLVAPFL